MRVFLDASVFIWALERPESNAARIVRMLLAGELDAVIDEEVIREVSRFVRRTLSRSHAWLYGQQIRRNATILSRAECETELEKLRGYLKAADRLHVAAMRASGASFLVAYDADFQGLPEYLTPKQAMRRLGRRVSSSEW